MADKTLIKKPLITEKASSLGVLNQYVFLVTDNATGPEVKKAIELIYKVKVATVRTLNIPSKTKRLGRSIGVKPGYRKAIVTLKKGEKLDMMTA
jgi:large subunit ribosomal protein L23